MSAPAGADVLIVNGQVVTLDARCPRADALAVRGGRILAVGSEGDLRTLAGPGAQVVDARGGLVTPSFHDAHLHLLAAARAASRVDCGDRRSLADLQAALRARARGLPPGAWVRATGYDESALAERRHLDRHDLDAAVPDRPVRVQHRTMHLDVLNTPALRELGLAESAAPEIERTDGGEPTGRLYNAASLLHRRLPTPAFAEIAEDVRRASARLLAWGVTAVQDATPTNDADTWALLERLNASEALPQRVFMLPGAAAAGSRADWPDAAGPTADPAGPAADPAGPAADPAGPTPGPALRLGPVKLLVDEASTGPEELRAAVAAARSAGHAVALHAVSDAEVVLALAALQGAGPRPPGAGPDRIEHGALLPDALLPDLRAAGVTVVGQPALLHARGDTYRADHPEEHHAWLYRVRTLLQHGIPYAASSDAPLTVPDPALGLFALRTRRTASGATLGAVEAIDASDALAAFTVGPAQAVGHGRELGRLRVGALADLVVLDRYWPDTPLPDRSPVRLTMLGGRIVHQSA